MTRYLLLSLVVLLLLQLCHLVRGKTDPPNVSAFNVVYKSLNSPSQLSGWSSSGGDPCGDDWKGITCSGSSVECLGLSGTLGYQLSSLTSVTYFDFSKNNLNGDIPYQLPPNSVHINLAGNTFTGGILHSISQMTELNYLNLANNQLSGQLTDMFGGLPKLSFISKPRMEQSLVRWATPQLHDIDALAGMVDPALRGLYPPKSLSRFTDVIAFCIQVEPEFRPAMSEVVHSPIRCIQLTSFNRRMGGDLSTTAAMIPMDTIEESFELIEHSFNSIKGHHHNLLDQSTALLIDWCTMSSEENLMEFMSLPFSVQESML